MSPTLRFLVIALASGSALAHGTGEPHLHAQDSLWLDALMALLVLGLGSAWAAQRTGSDGQLRSAALWAGRLCAAALALSATAAALGAGWGG